MHLDSLAYLRIPPTSFGYASSNRLIGYPLHPLLSGRYFIRHLLLISLRHYGIVIELNSFILK